MTREDCLRVLRAAPRAPPVPAVAAAPLAPLLRIAEPGQKPKRTRTPRKTGAK